MNFSKDMVFKQIDAVICDLRHLLISMEEFRENGDTNKLQKRIEELEKEVKWWQDRYNELYKNYQENGDINKLQKRIEELEKEVKWWQDRYNELYKNYLELLSCPRQKYRPYQPIWVNKTRSTNSFTFTL